MRGDKKLNIPPKERLKQIFEKTIDTGTSYDGEIKEIDFYSLLCKATSNNQLYKILGCSLSIFNYKYENEDSVLMVFSIPSSNDEKDTQSENKHISEKIMNVLEMVEECFVTLDYMDLNTIKEDKFVYMIIVKKVKEED